METLKELVRIESFNDKNNEKIINYLTKKLDHMLRK